MINLLLPCLVVEHNGWQSDIRCTVDRQLLLNSQIAEIVMLKFARESYQVLVLHDSFLLHHGLEQSLQDAMAEAFGGIVEVDQKTQKPLKFNYPEWGSILAKTV